MAADQRIMLQTEIIGRGPEVCLAGFGASELRTLE
ncbi:hypothetical protein Mal65_25900 [Crateriforma conspicua]|nr:hypothetical protein Mal65_25900 [Crateriforma conspicua]